MMVIFLLLSALCGWLVAGLGNWAADELPKWNRESPHPLRLQRADWTHYWTLGWWHRRAATCPHCNELRSWRAPALEIATIVLFVAAGYFFMGQWQRLLLVWLYSAFLLVVLVIDYEHRRVLNVMMLPAYPLAFLASFTLGQPDPWHSLLGGGVGLLMFMVLAIIGRGALGMGDVKLAGLIGLMISYPAVLPALLLGIILAGLVAIYMLLIQRAGRKATMAYAPYMAIGAILILWRIVGKI